MRSTKPQPGIKEVLIPGDPERRAYQKRITEGIPVNKEVVASLKTIAEDTGIELKMQ